MSTDKKLCDLIPPHTHKPSYLFIYFSMEVVTVDIRIAKCADSRNVVKCSVRLCALIPEKDRLCYHKCLTCVMCGHHPPLGGGVEAKNIFRLDHTKSIVLKLLVSR